MNFLPGVPLVHASPSIAFAEGVSGYVPDPLNNESFAPVTVN
jgi:peptide/nickel transport system substrate-binding protein